MANAAPRLRPRPATLADGRILPSPSSTIRASPVRVTIVFLRWRGVGEGDKVSGDGSAELQDDGSIEIELSFDNGEAILTGRRE